MEQNSGFEYLKDKPVHFFPLPCRKVFGGYVLTLDRIILFGEYDEPTLIFSISRELEHMHYRHQNGIFKSIYNFIFNRREMEKRATRRAFSMLERMGKRNYLKWLGGMIESYSRSVNPIEKLSYEINYKQK
jgi:hypothetical protein